MGMQIRIGLMAPHIGEQLPDLDAEKADHFNRDAEAICRLFARGMLAVSERRKAEKRLVKAISAEIRRA